MIIYRFGAFFYVSGHFSPIVFIKLAKKCITMKKTLSYYKFAPEGTNNIRYAYIISNKGWRLAVGIYG